MSTGGWPAAAPTIGLKYVGRVTETLTFYSLALTLCHAECWQWLSDTACVPVFLRARTVASDRPIPTQPTADDNLIMIAATVIL